MSINMILACGLNGEIGCSTSHDGLPWSKNKEDLTHFQKMTTGNVVVYGGNTFRQFQKMGMENGLPDRDNYVISRDHSRQDEYIQSGGMKIMEYLLRIDYWERPVFIIGGKAIYDQLHPHCDKVYLTRINQEFPEADVRISLDFLQDFDIISTKVLNNYSHVEVWERKN